MVAVLERFKSAIGWTSAKPVAPSADASMMPPAINARYDAAQDTSEFANYWAAADRLDSNSANSKGVRSKLVSRSRYEIANNAYSDGMAQTHANYVVGKGPKLRMQTASRTFNQMVEAEWQRWSKACRLRRKLWVMAHAKLGDGESLGICRSNPRLKHPVKLDVVVVETEQCTTPYLDHGMEGYVDGIRFDSFGNPIYYDILPYHPGGTWRHMQPEPDQVPADYVLHWFALRRPGQQRGVPEMKSSLNVGAGSRRWREATIAAAETAADISVLLQTQNAPQLGPTPATPFSQIEFTKRMMTALPAGWNAGQMKAEHPNATYEAFHRAQVSEQSRPKNMPHNLAAGDSSNHNFASGKLDFTPYYMQVDVEREDGDDLVLDPLFELWFEEAALRFGWVKVPGQVPDHSWDWPSHPVADEKAKAQANENRLRTGQVSISRMYAEDGQDFEEILPKMAADYGVTPERMREVLLQSTFNDRGALSAMAQVEETSSQTDADSESGNE